MKGIVWFRSDLRVDDNPALNAALSNCDEVLAIYIFSVHKIYFVTINVYLLSYSNI